MIRELDVVTLTRDVREPQLPKGSRGAVVHCYDDGQGFEVEFGLLKRSPKSKIIPP